MSGGLQSAAHIRPNEPTALQAVVVQFLLPRTTNAVPEVVLATRALFVFSALAATTGLAAMAGRSGKSESVLLGVSTIAAVVAFFLAP